MIRFYEFPSSDTLIVLDTEKQLAARFPLRDIKRGCTDLKIWWGNDDITDYSTRDFESTLDALEVSHV